MKRFRGLKNLVIDAVEHGSKAIEKVQIDSAKLPFDLLEKIPPLKVPVSGVRMIYNTSISNVHGMIRLVSKVAGDTVDVVLDGIRPAETAPGEAEKAPAAEGAQKRTG